ncbi:MAG: energy transducer TonB [Vulcanimicrobiaceae bacterium]
MDARRARRLLLAALILSLLIHGIIALSVRWRVTPPRETPQRVTIARRDIIHITTRPAVSPPPSPLPATPRPAAERHRIAPPKAVALTPGQRGPVRPVAARSPEAARTAAPAPCAKANEPAAVAVEPPAPDPSVEARARGVSGTTSVNVKLDERGAVVDATIGESSGDPSLDDLALTTAKFAQYTPALHLCKAIASTYAFRVRFAAW